MLFSVFAVFRDRLQFDQEWKIKNRLPGRLVLNFFIFFFVIIDNNNDNDSESENYYYYYYYFVNKVFDYSQYSKRERSLYYSLFLIKPMCRNVFLYSLFSLIRTPYLRLERLPWRRTL